MEVSPAGQLLCQRLGAPLHALRAALNLDAMSCARLPLKVLTLSSMADTWLIGHLPSFGAAHPHIALSVETGYDMVRLPPQLPAVAIRFGHFGRTGLRCHRLWFDHMVAVAAPGWIAQYGGQSAKWPAHQLLRHTHDPWPLRLPKDAVHGAAKIPQASGDEFKDALLLTEAAGQCRGVAWVRASLMQRFVADGQLCVLVQAAQVSDKSVWLVCPQDAGNLGTIEQTMRQVLHG